MLVGSTYLESHTSPESPPRIRISPRYLQSSSCSTPTVRLHLDNLFCFTQEDDKSCLSPRFIPFFWKRAKRYVSDTLRVERYSSKHGGRIGTSIHTLRAKRSLSHRINMLNITILSSFHWILYAFLFSTSHSFFYITKLS